VIDVLDLVDNNTMPDDKRDDVVERRPLRERSRWMRR
jgi:hypothetical protein